MILNEPRIGRMHRRPHDTETEAARAIAPLTGRLRLLVLSALSSSPTGLTDDEGARVLRFDMQLLDTDRLTFGRRRNELAIDGYVEDSGERRLTPHGRSAIVWRITASGAKALDELIERSWR